jgi:hypothetical protein
MIIIKIILGIAFGITAIDLCLGIIKFKIDLDDRKRIIVYGFLGKFMIWDICRAITGFYISFKLVWFLW